MNKYITLGVNQMFKQSIFKKPIAFLLILTILFTFAACNQGNPDVDDSSEERNGSTEIKIVDHLGREVVLEEPAENIVSGYYITTSMLIALGLEDSVTGIEAKAESRPIYKLAAPHFLDLPSVGTMKEFDLEGAASLNPDLV